MTPKRIPNNVEKLRARVKIAESEQMKMAERLMDEANRRRSLEQQLDAVNEEARARLRRIESLIEQSQNLRQKLDAATIELAEYRGQIQRVHDIDLHEIKLAQAQYGGGD